ncbi:hypothetical protein BGX34_010487 [Mortierella sp. NVP85]|nr:hypothetical protein BGX34_010487 [Mortierella sp. NVP85]
MVFGSIVESPVDTLSPKQALQLANVYLDNARKIEEPVIALVLCHDTEVTLSRATKAVKRTEDQATVRNIGTAYIELGELLEKRGHATEADVSYKKAAKLGVVRQPKVAQPSATEPEPSKPISITSTPLEGSGTNENTSMIPARIFKENVRLPTIESELPEADERLKDTPQLAYCLSLLRFIGSADDQLEPATKNWLQAVEKDTDEQERLHTMAIDVIRAFKRDELKDAKAVAEVVYLAPVLNNDTFHDVLRELYSGIDHSGLLNVHYLEGLGRLIHGAHPGLLHADDLVKILDLLSKRLRDTHVQSTHHMHRLTLAVSRVLDAMVDTNVTGLDREKLHHPLHNYLGELKLSRDPFLVYQAAYAYQALLCVPDNETIWQTAMRRTGKVLRGVSGLVSAVKGFDLYKFMMGLDDIQKGFGGASMVINIVKHAYDDISALVEGGHGFVDSLKEGFNFERKRDWYSALRGADMLIQAGEFATFNELVCKVPCRLDPAFQWGVCQRLGEVASNPTWDLDTRRGAIELLGEIYRDDEVWGRHAGVKQWIIAILVQLSSPQGPDETVQCM